MSRRGIGLVELMVALTLTGVAAALSATILSRAAALLRDRADRAATEHALRVSANAVRAALESLGEDSTTSDLTAISSGGFIARVTRGSGVLCWADASEVVARRGAGWWRAIREPVAGRDSLLLGKLTEPGWIAIPLRADPGSTRCPDGTPGLAMPIALDPALAAAIGPGSPIRFFEPVEFAAYSSSGSDWLGLRLLATGEPIQPLSGPLARSGLTLSYFSKTGQTTGLAPDVASVNFRLAALTERGTMRDSVSGFVALGNR